MSKRITFQSCINYAKRNGIAFTMSGNVDTATVWFEVCDAADGYLSSQCWAIGYDYINRGYNTRYSHVTMLDYRGYAFQKDLKLLDMIRKALDSDRAEVMKYVSYSGKYHWFGCDCDE